MVCRLFKKYSKLITYLLFIICIFYSNYLFSEEISKGNSLTIKGLAQPRFTYSKSSQEKNQSNFDIALGKLTFTGTTLSPNVSYFIQLEGSTFSNSNNIYFVDWWIQYNFNDQYAIKMGRFLLPYSRQFFTFPGELLFADLSSSDFVFNLPRAIGAMFTGSYSILSFNLAVLNGIRALDNQGEQNTVLMLN